MDFGIAFPSYLNAWKDAALAEDNGFTHAWFYDSQMIYSDVYVCMALAAEHTRRIKLDRRKKGTVPFSPFFSPFADRILGERKG